MNRLLRPGLLCVAFLSCGPAPQLARPDIEVPPTPVPAKENSDAGPVAPTFPQPLSPGEFTGKLDRASIRQMQPWIDDAGFDAKWVALLKTPIEFLGGTPSAFHADLATLDRARFPGGETLCHGDPKLDNFGWTRVEGKGVFSDNDFDEAGYCPVAVDALRFLLATNLWFSSAALDDAVLESYLAAVSNPSQATAVDPSSEPLWDDLRTKVLKKTTSGGKLILGGNVQAPTPEEGLAVRALLKADPRFDPNVLDVARDVHTTGGSAGLRRFWVLGADAQDRQSLVELKELTTPATEFGPHSRTLQGDDRFDVLKRTWWGTPGPADHFQVQLLGAHFLVRSRLTRSSPNPDKLTTSQLEAMLRAEAGLLALRHREAWGAVDPAALKNWLQQSAVTVNARWRAAYLAASAN